MHVSASVAASILLLTVASLAAQERPGSVTGTVFDSIASRPLTGAVVFVRGTDRIAVTDGEGRFAIEGVAPGEHHLVFAHPQVDSLGLSPITAPVRIESGGDARVSLAIPSIETLHSVLCGGPLAGRGVLIGLVRDERTGALVAGAQVSAAWRGEGPLDMSVAVTDAAGRYALCGLPRDTHITLWVSKGGQRSGDGLVQLRPPAAPVRRDLEIDLGSVVRLIGLVVDAENGTPLRNALVSVEEETVLSGRDGRFLLEELETGRHSVKVSLLGYQPADDTLLVAAGTHDMVVRMSPDPIELDPITVTAVSGHLEAQGFYERMRRGTGVFLTRQEIALRRAAHVTDLLRATPGVTVQPSRDRPGYDLVLRGGCQPTYYLNGIPQVPGTFHLNNLGPENIEALEVYSSAARVPPQFRQDSRATDPRGVTTSCSGAVVVWLR